ncbi:MAG: TIM barrel protein [Verrucomicrobia bacterium]|nr:TIM barrel protein [Verrucomicrobiota bacterium]
MTAPISRRSALRTLVGGATVAGLAASLAARVTAADAVARLKGRINHSVCKSCYPKASLDDLCRAAKAIGITSIDLMPPPAWPTLKKHGLTCAMAKVHEPNHPESWVRPAEHDKLVGYFTEVIPQVANAGLPNLICLSGNARGLSKEQGLENCALGLRRIMPLAEKHRVTICLELLNSKVNHKDYMADSTAFGVELVRRVGSERFKLLFDIYHMQIMEGDVIATINAIHQHIAHYHLAGVPGRHEPDETQELNYPAIMRAIVATGYNGHVAYEYSPARPEPDAVASLRRAVQICDV